MTETEKHLFFFSQSLMGPKWVCKACTFLNQYDNSSYEICGTRNLASSLSTLGNDDLDELGSSVGDVFFPSIDVKYVAFSPATATWAGQPGSSAQQWGNTSTSILSPEFAVVSSPSSFKSSIGERHGWFCATGAGTVQYLNI
ncbi:hypothetical protein M9H77_22166 [Catharanthus roseus]|uniref:Uncharacterized protein n=1 Tax=Catharanthus roseus TaxID=4058 RepID=A0ACC0ATR3_CATRO|nr:hypothetical protein M9H77_22166 [Catharanthus roseus]